MHTKIKYIIQTSNYIKRVQRDFFALRFFIFKHTDLFGGSWEGEKMPHYSS